MYVCVCSLQGSDDDVVMVDASDPESESSSDDDDVYEERDDSRDADYMPDTAVHGETRSLCVCVCV